MIANGMNHLEKQRSELYQLLRKINGDYPADLSPRWQGQGHGGAALASQLPLWVFVSAAAALLLIVYLGFSLYIDTASDGVFKELLQLSREPLDTVVAAPGHGPQPPKASNGLDRF